MLDHAAEMELRREADYYRALAEQMERALTSRIRIEQAKGMLAERYRVDLDDAFEILRRYCRSNHLNIHDAARALLPKGRRPDHVLAAPRPVAQPPM